MMIGFDPLLPAEVVVIVKVPRAQAQQRDTTHDHHFTTSRSPPSLCLDDEVWRHLMVFKIAGGTGDNDGGVGSTLHVLTEGCYGTYFSPRGWLLEQCSRSLRSFM